MIEKVMHKEAIMNIYKIIFTNDVVNVTIFIEYIL